MPQQTHAGSRGKSWAIQACLMFAVLFANNNCMEKDQEKNSASGNKQSDFAGTNPDMYGAPKPEDQQDNPVDAHEADNVTDGAERLSGKEAEAARNKATEGSRQGRD